VWLFSKISGPDQRSDIRIIRLQDGIDRSDSMEGHFLYSLCPERAEFTAKRGQDFAQSFQWFRKKDAILGLTSTGPWGHRQQLIARIREQNPSVPVIFVAGFNSENAEPLAGFRTRQQPRGTPPEDRRSAQCSARLILN
jgi:hypothetical protein